MKIQKLVCLIVGILPLFCSAQKIYLQSNLDNTFICYNLFTKAVYKQKSLEVNCYFHTIAHAQSPGVYFLQALTPKHMKYSLYLSVNQQNRVVLDIKPEISWLKSEKIDNKKNKKYFILSPIHMMNIYKNQALYSDLYQKITRLGQSTNVYIKGLNLPTINNFIFTGWNQ